MGILAMSDRAAGGLAEAATTLGQLALVCLGVHLAADRLDDVFVAGILGAQAGLDSHLAGPLQSLSAALDLAPDTLLVWEMVPVAPVAAGAALLVEAAAVLAFAGTFLLTERAPPLTWARYRAALGVHALVSPVALAGVLLAGSWSMAMAAEDLLPPSVWARAAGGLVGAAALARFGLAAWRRAVAALEPDRRWWVALGSTALLGPVGALAWAHGVPVWGLVRRGIEAAVAWGVA